MWDMSVECVLSGVCLGLDSFLPKLWLNETPFSFLSVGRQHWVME